MRRESDAVVVLRRLLERYERGAGGRRIIERPAQAFEDPDDLRNLTDNLREAARTGAVELVWDKDAPHLVEKVVLVDPPRLYAFTGRAQPQQILTEAISALDVIDVATGPGRELLQDLRNAWGAGRKLAGLAAADVLEAVSLVRSIDAAFADLGPDIPLRTRSARLLGDSKALERAVPAMLAYLRQAGVIAPDLSRNDALEQLGLNKYPQPVLVAGGLTFSGVDVSGWPYAGIPPDLAAAVQTTSAIRSLLTVENLESFNRHVRRCREPGDVVIYTGGFPSNAVLALLRALTEQADMGIHHWGDIDPGGIRIGRHLELSLGVSVQPHLMNVEIVRSRGRPADLGQIVPILPAESAFFPLCEYLRAHDALWLEQEVVDPQRVF